MSEDFDPEKMAEEALKSASPGARAAKPNGHLREEDKALSVDDFYCYMPTPNSYIFTPTRDMWPATSVNARVSAVAIDGVQVKANTWLAKHRPVEQITWAPGLPMLIKGRVISDGGWIDRSGSDCFNLYRPPTIQLGDPTKAGPWIGHVQKVFPDDAAHIIYYLAQRVQRPEEKINHALVLGGNQGIGKDTILEGVKQAVAPWNWREISPQAMLGQFNSFARSVVLRVNEVCDLGELNRYQFYEHMKIYTASPPDVLRVNEKFLREHYVLNCTGVIITTNHRLDGMYLPADDRRHYVAWSEAKQADFPESYWRKMWHWYMKEGGFEHVAAYLANLDLSDFDPKKPPPKTEAFWTVANAHRTPEDAELADVLEGLGHPNGVTIGRLQSAATGDFAFWLGDRKNRRNIPHRLESCGYVPVRNPDAKDGLWKIGGARQVAYAKETLALSEQIKAVREL